MAQPLYMTISCDHLPFPDFNLHFVINTLKWFRGKNFLIPDTFVAFISNVSYLELYSLKVLIKMMFIIDHT